jgi:hypothetical protein
MTYGIPEKMADSLAESAFGIRRAPVPAPAPGERTFSQRLDTSVAFRQREAEARAADAARKVAEMPPRPQGWDKLSATSRRSWWLANEGKNR